MSDTFIIFQPEQLLTLKITAKMKYKHEQWKIRYNKWCKKTGHKPYQEIVPEIGNFNGVCFK